MALAVVQPIGTAKRFQFQSPQVLEDFEQELVDQYALAAAGAGTTDGYTPQVREPKHPPTLNMRVTSLGSSLSDLQKS
jgi:hypothetical protein